MLYAVDFDMFTLLVIAEFFCFESIYSNVVGNTC